MVDFVIVLIGFGFGIGEILGAISEYMFATGGVRRSSLVGVLFLVGVVDGVILNIGLVIMRIGLASVFGFELIDLVGDSFQFVPSFGNGFVHFDY